MSERRAAGAGIPRMAQWLFWPALILTLAILAVFSVIDAPLRVGPASEGFFKGIIAFELAGSVAVSQAMLDAWDAHARLNAAFALGLDYLYMPSYALAIGLAAAWAGRQLGAWRRCLIGLGRALAWGLGVAAVLDAIENFALLKILLAGATVPPWPTVAAACATVKFGLVILGLAYALAGVVFWLLARLRRE